VVFSGDYVMPKNTSMTLGPHFEEFIAERVSKGRYGSASEVVRAGLRLLENRETKLETLRALLTEGEKSGFADYSYHNLIQELDDEG
jgi:antitoxin ParD1/3/4